MKLIVLSSFILFLFLVRIYALDSSNLIECEKVHRIDEVENFRGILTELTRENQCTFKCRYGNTTLVHDTVYWGKCPLDQNGVCQHGKCSGDEKDAVMACGGRFDIGSAFKKVTNHNGTAFVNDQCWLKCVADGKVLSSALNHDGMDCPGNRIGICHKGKCEIAPINQNYTPRPDLERNDHFEPEKLNSLDIAIVSITPETSNEHFLINFCNQVHGANNKIHSQICTPICDFYGNVPITKYLCNLTAVKSIPNQLDQNTILSIKVAAKDGHNIGQHQESIFKMFEFYYRVYRHNWGLPETWKVVVPIYSVYQTKLAQIELSLTVRFDKI